MLLVKEVSKQPKAMVLVIGISVVQSFQHFQLSQTGFVPEKQNEAFIALKTHETHHLPEFVSSQKPCNYNQYSGGMLPSPKRKVLT